MTSVEWSRVEGMNKPSCPCGMASTVRGQSHCSRAMAAIHDLACSAGNAEPHAHSAMVQLKPQQAPGTHPSAARTQNRGNAVRLDGKVLCVGSLRPPMKFERSHTSMFAAIWQQLAFFPHSKRQWPKKEIKIGSTRREEANYPETVQRRSRKMPDDEEHHTVETHQSRPRGRSAPTLPQFAYTSV